MLVKPQLFLLHFAGGNKYSFNFLKEWLEPTFEVISLELPGRGNRVKERLLKEKSEAVQDYLKQIQSARKQVPYLIYGHSMGASLGFEVTSILEESQDPPEALILTGNPGPEVGECKNRHKMSDDEFKNELNTLGGVLKEFIENEELYTYFSTILRADFKLLEKTHNQEFKGVLKKVPIIAIMGTNEEHADKIDNWKRYTNNNAITQLLEGNHFFIHKHSKRLAETIIKVIKSKEGEI